MCCFSWRVGRGGYWHQHAVCQLLSRVRLFVTPQTICHWAPLSMGFSKQGSWNGLPFLPPRHLPEPGIKPLSPGLLCLLHCKWIQLPLSLWGQRVVVSPISMEGNSCCATNICPLKTVLSVLSGLFEVLVVWPAWSVRCTLPPGTSEKKEDFGFDWERLLNIINAGRRDNHPVNKMHGGHKHIQNQPWLWNKSDSSRVVIYLFISLRFPHLFNHSLLWADPLYPSFLLCPGSATAASGTRSILTLHSSHCGETTYSLPASLWNVN